MVSGEGANDGTGVLALRKRGSPRDRWHRVFSTRLEKDLGTIANLRGDCLTVRTPRHDNWPRRGQGRETLESIDKETRTVALKVEEKLRVALTRKRPEPRA